MIIGVIVDNTMSAAKSNDCAKEKLEMLRHMQLVEKVLIVGRIGGARFANSCKVLYQRTRDSIIASIFYTSY